MLRYSGEIQRLIVIVLTAELPMLFGLPTMSPSVAPTMTPTIKPTQFPSFAPVGAGTAMKALGEAWAFASTILVIGVLFCLGNRKLGRDRKRRKRQKQEDYAKARA